MGRSRHESPFGLHAARASKLEGIDRHGQLAVRRLLHRKGYFLRSFGVADSRRDRAATFERSLVLARRRRDYFFAEEIERFCAFRARWFCFATGVRGVRVGIFGGVVDEGVMRVA